ncbi:MAG TPA: site-specific integrase [Stellaceae bacterium]|jgi:integrase|nr:site-specific integrase [Stellaceae bacterium]
MRQLETRTARARLPIAPKPVYARLETGLSLGYRKNASGGAWVVRLADGNRGNFIKRIGTTDDDAPADGKDTLNWGQACEAARRLQRTGSTEPEAKAIVTVKDAIDAYASGAVSQANVTRLRHNLTPALGKRPVALLTAKELASWRDGMAKRIAPATANRTATVLKATLNKAAEDDATLQQRAWEIGLSAIEDATVARNEVRSWPVICAIVAECYGISAEFGVLCEALAQTGARISQLARCEVRDLIRVPGGDALSVRSSAKGKKKRIVREPVPIPAELADKLRVAIADRPLDDALFLKPSAEPWRHSDHSRPFARAAKRAGEAPETTTVYMFRHSHICDQLLAGVPIAVVAKLHDTSAAMIERHYADQIGSMGDSAARKAQKSIALPKADVIPLRGQTL